MHLNNAVFYLYRIPLLHLIYCSTTFRKLLYVYGFEWVDFASISIDDLNDLGINKKIYDFDGFLAVSIKSSLNNNCEHFAQTFEEH